MAVNGNISLSELASLVDAEVIGNGDQPIRRVATLKNAGADGICFYTNSRYRRDLQKTQAGAVILKDEHISDCPTSAVIVKDPYYAYAAIANHLHPREWAKPGIHPTATVSPDAVLGKGVAIGPHVTVEAGVHIGEGTEVGAGTFLGRNVRIGAGSWLASGVTLEHECVFGDRVVLHSGVVIGADGFGFAPGSQGWRKVPQLGRVCVGDDVDIGANSTIDRGTLDDTVVERGVKIDNLVHIGHNSRIGADTIIAGCTVVAGSTHIGKQCVIGGSTAITGHIEIADGVTLMGGANVTGNIRETGVYASPLPIQPVREWRRNAARFSRLDEMFRGMKSLEKELGSLKGQNGNGVERRLG